MKPPRVELGQWWRFGAEEGRVERLLPGGAGNLGIAVLTGEIPPAHVNTMMRFNSWAFLPDGPTHKALPPPCSCRELPGGVILSDGCALHDANAATPITTEPTAPPGALGSAARHRPRFTDTFTPKDPRS